MPHDSLAWPDCGRLVEFRVGEDAVCECGKTLARILATEESSTDQRKDQGA